MTAVGARRSSCAPDDDRAYERLHALLRADLDAPGRAAAFDALLSHRLAARR